MKQRVIALLLVLAMVSAVIVSAVAEEPAQENGEVTTITAVNPAETTEESGAAGSTAATETAGTTETEGTAEEPSSGVDSVTGEELPEATEDMLLFSQLEELVKKNNLSYKSLGATISAMDELEETSDNLKSGIAQIQSQIAQLDPTEDAAEIAALQKQVAEMQQGLSSVSGMVQDTTQMEAGRKQLILGAQSLFIALVGMEQQEEELERQLAALDRTVREMELRKDVGQVSRLQLMELRSGRASLVSGLATLRMNITNYTMQLEQMVGKKMTGKTPLGTLPAVTDAELDALDFEADLKMVLRRSTDVQAASASQDQVYDMSVSMSGMSDAISDMQDAADYTYKEAKQQAEMKFRMLYAQLQDCRQIIKAAETALECEKLAYQATELKYQQGTVSKNALLTAEDELKTAEDSLRTAKNDLFSTYNNYCWAVKHGVLS